LDDFRPDEISGMGWVLHKVSTHAALPPLDGEP
jgi:hypothetical protein